MGELEYASKCKTALLKKDEWKTCAGNIVDAGIHPQYGGQAAVREKMRSKKVGEDKDEEADQKSYRKVRESVIWHNVLMNLHLRFW